MALDLSTLTAYFKDLEKAFEDAIARAKSVSGLDEMLQHINNIKRLLEDRKAEVIQQRTR